MSETTLENMVLLSFKDADPAPQLDEIEKRTRALAAVINISDETIGEIIKRVQSNLVTTMDEGVSLVDVNDDHDEEWVYKKEAVSWDYWTDYERHLAGEGWGPKVVHTMGEVTDKILGLLKDPDTTGVWDRRGLVIGHVQSGKTANYIGLISKAADAGYRFIIVIAGIHNNLRKQTQERIDEGFIGRNGETKQLIGVGELHKGRAFPIPLTNTASDFSKKFASANTADLAAYDRPVILVIKKHVSTLSNVYSWLKELNADQSDQISKVPMLLIDDEADHASINTNKLELDPTRTNAEIRRLLKLFKKSCYVGYTATPFANIFINPDDENQMLDDDLFPRDFIYCLDAPTNYFGANKVFLDEDVSNQVLRSIDDAEDYIPLSHKKHDEISDLPPSAKKAIKTFILAKAIRCLRNQSNKHCSMMFNVSRFVDIQRQVRDHTSHYLTEVKNAIFSNYRKPGAAALRSRIMSELKDVFDLEFKDYPELWEDVQLKLFEASDDLKTYLINSKSDEILDYKKYDQSGDALTALAVGGLSLSRGLTLEGLTVSYMYRNSKMYDTLMQMGRWFGYRPGYEDLCRVYLSDDSQGWYSHIAEASEDLRQQVKQMRRDGFSPKDFGLYVRAHPDTLIVTALNKMRHAKKMTFKVSFDNKIQETHIIPSEQDICDNNLSHMIKLYGKLETKYGSPLFDDCYAKGSVFWKSVPMEYVLDFIGEFRFHRVLQWMKEGFLSYAKEVSKDFPEWDIAFISLGNPSRPVDGLPIQIQKRQVGRDRTSKIIKIPNEEKGWYIGNRQRVGDPQVEGVGLSSEQIRKVKELTNGKKLSGHHFRNMGIMNKPLLMLHVLDLYDENTRKQDAKNIAKNIPAIGFSFPAANDIRSVDCVVNKVWLIKDMFDSPDEEDDYDI